MKRIIMVGNTHFDPVWLWRWDEAMASIRSTFRSALERMKEDENFCYSFSAPSVFEWIKNTDPGLFEKIKGRIAEGRWELGEGWWLQPDCNSASGESYIRHGLYTQKYFEKNFGKTCDTVFNIDSFGHSAQLPQIISKCGMKNYAFWRPNEEHMHLPQALFRWVGIDGSSLKCYRVGGTGGEIFTENFEKDTMEKIFEDNTSHDIMCVFGVTDHGGAPTKSQMEIINRLSEERNDCIIKFGTEKEFFDGVSEMPEVRGELQVKFIGPYSNINEIKKNNRKAEYACQNAESASVIAEKLCGKEYPKEKLRSAWLDVLFNQFHDILGGTSIKSAYFDARNLHGRAIQTANEVMHYALQTVTASMKMPGRNPDNEWNIAVWNLNGFEYTSPVEAEVQWAWEFPWYSGGIELEDEKGIVYPCQIITEECTVPGFRSRFVFRDKIPSFGCKTYIVRKTNKPCTGVSESFESTGFRLEKSDFGFDITDKKTGKTYKNMFAPYVLGDICDTWGFNKTVFENEKFPFELVSLKTTESGDLRTSVKAEYSYGKSTFEQTITMYDDIIDVSWKVLWNEKHKALKIGFPAKKCTVSIPAGFIERGKCEFERPMSEWIKTENFAIASDSAFAYGFDGEKIGITILRSCIFGDLRTEELKEREYEYTDQGETAGRFRLCFEDIAHEAIALNNPPVIISEANHGGKLPSENSIFSCGGALITAVKQTEDGKNTVIRITEENGCETAARLYAEGKIYETALRPFEIKTVIYDGENFTETDMLEAVSC